MFFGEMALLNEIVSIRNSSVVAQTNLILAVLSESDFKLICQHYPNFKAGLEEVVASRSPRKTPTTVEEPSEKPSLIKLVTKKNLSIIHESKRESAANDEEFKLEDASVTKRTQTIFKKNLKINIKDEEEDWEEQTERRQ